MHLIDMSNDRANIAYVGEQPWHGLGTKLQPDAPLETWLTEAGLNYTVNETPVLYATGTEANGASLIERYNDRKVLFRSDTGTPLSVVSKDYRVVQPGMAMEFFRDLNKAAGFEMEVAGCLDDGKRVWALAKVNDGAEIIGHDTVRPYLLWATSYDGTLSTTAKFTAVRVVCHNTLTMAAGYADGSSRTGQMEKDQTEGAVVTCVRVPHSKEFDPAVVKRQLGIVLSAWDRFLIESRLLAHTPVDDGFVIEFLKKLLPQRKIDGKIVPVEEGRAFAKLMAIWNGEAPSATLPEAQGTAWGLLNAVTWYVDHERGSDGNRLSSAWFGTGDALKSKAQEMLVKVAA